METPSASLTERAYESLINGDYARAAGLYEETIEAEPHNKSNYWYLGLLLLLQGQEQEAQTTWLLGMADGSSEQIDRWTGELFEVLHREAERRETQEDYPVAVLIREHLREIAPGEINNLLHLLRLGIELKNVTPETLDCWGILEQLQAALTESFDLDLLLEVLKKWLQFAPVHPFSLEFAKICLPHLRQKPGSVDLFKRTAIQVAYWMHQPTTAIAIAQLGLQITPPTDRAEILRDLAGFYLYSGNHSRGIEIAKQFSALTQSVPEKIVANHLVLQGLLAAGGYWQEAHSVLLQQEQMLQALVNDPPTELTPATAARLLTSPYLFPYVQDEPQSNKCLQNQVSALFQSYKQVEASEQVEKYHKRILSLKENQQKPGGGLTRPLKIGYISNCLRSHSVGWLARWVFQYHDRDRFQVYGYFLNGQIDDPLQQWYGDRVFQARYLGYNSREIAEQIYKDEIDIAIDLDSLTLDATCEVMALKPAPVQVTWLGWDASGIPAIDYFIADPYVLPKDAEDYYCEKIWRLPQTYIAVDGFEVGVPTLRRDRLEIPMDAVVYYSGQTGFKRHPETARQQIQIIKAVPNSYLLIKTRGEGEAVQRFFTELAAAEGVECDRLRFLPPDPSEMIHRANLGIADVVLDTYPYNGATTTLETLWMGIPLVTRVGEQFAARNSYTMMMNVGVTEGIARTDKEYLEWGIRLGSDSQLRRQISGKLRQSRQTSPLWNGKQFTREMEKAYEEMWRRSIESPESNGLTPNS